MSVQEQVLQPATFLKPKILADYEVIPYTQKDKRARFVIKDSQSQHYILSNIAGIRIIMLMDGTHTLSDIQNQLRHEYKINISTQKIIDFIDLCNINNLLQDGTWKVVSDVERHNYHTRRRRRFGFYTRLWSIDSFLDTLVNYRHWWLNSLTISIWVTLASVGIFYTVINMPNMGIETLFGPFLEHQSLKYIFFLLILLLIQTALHELSHAVACHLVNARSKGFGFGLLWWVIPIFFTDTTDVYCVKSRYKRMAVSAAGPAVDLLFLGIFALLIFLLPETSIGSTYAQAYIVYPLMVLLINLNPFLIRFDGYWILADYLQEPRLRQTAFQHVWVTIKKILGFSFNNLLLVSGKTGWVLIVYIVLAIGWTGLVVIFLAQSNIQSITEVGRVFLEITKNY